MNYGYPLRTVLHAIPRLLLYSVLFTLPVIASARIAKQAVTPKVTSQPVQRVPEKNSTVNINQASAEELATQLKGVGQKRAQAIVEYRQQQGLFINIEQLVEVPGISPLIVEQNRERLTV